MRPLPSWVALSISLAIHAQLFLAAFLFGGGLPWSAGERGLAGAGGDTIEITVRGSERDEPLVVAPDPQPEATPEPQRTPEPEVRAPARQVLASRDRAPDAVRERVAAGERSAEPAETPTSETPAPTAPSRAGSDRERTGRAPGAEAAAVILGSLGLGSGREASRSLLESALRCSDPIAGVWTAHRYSPERRNWGRMTLRIRREGDELRGTITSRVWSGLPSDPTPLRCGPGRYDTTVRMPARGRLQGESFTFGSRDYEVTRVDCAYEDFMYYPDSFRGTVDPMRDEMDALNNDGHVEFDAPYNFRRTSCGRD